MADSGQNPGIPQCVVVCIDMHSSHRCTETKETERDGTGLTNRNEQKTEQDRVGLSSRNMVMTGKPVNTLELAYLNREMIPVKKKAADALKVIHGNLYIFAYGSIMSY